MLKGFLHCMNMPMGETLRMEMLTSKRALMHMLLVNTPHMRMIIGNTGPHEKLLAKKKNVAPGGQQQTGKAEEHQQPTVHTNRSP